VEGRSGLRALPDGLAIYAVGDLHGRLDLLEEMQACIRADLFRSRPRESVEIFLGDYIDRGPQSCEVVERLISTPPLADKRVCLMGNHEDMLLKALDDAEGLVNWLHNGGDATLASYGLNVRPFAAKREHARIRALLLERLSQDHLAFFRGLRRCVEFGPYLFVHAGIRPGRPVADQDPADLLWIREPFLLSDEDFGRIVVHGHTPVDRPEVRRNRINIDTGAFFTGRLTCLVLERTTHRFLHTGPELRACDADSRW
jgi:serine/threonine protein phosphatase 1